MMNDPRKKTDDGFANLTDDESFDSLEDHMSEDERADENQDTDNSAYEDDPWVMQTQMQQKYDRSNTKYAIWD